MKGNYKDLIKKIVNILFAQFKNAPYITLYAKELLGNFKKEQAEEEEEINTVDFEVALKYLKEKNYIEIFNEQGSTLEFHIRIKPLIIDLAE